MIRALSLPRKKVNKKIAYVVFNEGHKGGSSHKADPVHGLIISFVYESS